MSSWQPKQLGWVMTRLMRWSWTPSSPPRKRNRRWSTSWRRSSASQDRPSRFSRPKRLLVFGKPGCLFKKNMELSKRTENSWHGNDVMLNRLTPCVFVRQLLLTLQETGRSFTFVPKSQELIKDTRDLCLLISITWISSIDIVLRNHVRGRLHVHGHTCIHT